MPNKPQFPLNEILYFLAKHGYTCTGPVITPTDKEWQLTKEGFAYFDFNRHSFLKNGEIPSHDIHVIAHRSKSALDNEGWELHSVGEYRG